jgi:hypothetical protein
MLRDELNHVIEVSRLEDVNAARLLVLGASKGILRAERERDLSFRRQSGMAAGKDETEAVVLDFLILVTALLSSHEQSGG